MAKQKAFLLVGLPHAGVPLLTAALEAHRHSLAAAGVRVPARSSDETFRAAVEVRREHRAWGLRRKDVEGAWAQICRRASKHDDTVVIGHELFAGAATEEIALLVDGLAGCRVHVVVLASVPDGRVGLFPDELDLGSVVTRWEHAVPSPDRLHVVVADPADPAVGWRALGDLVGFDADVLPMPQTTGIVPPVDTASLRLIAESAGLQVDHDELVELAEHWAKVVAEHGYDVRGDLRDLVPAEPVASSGSREPALAAYDDRVGLLGEALAEAVTEIGRLREELTLLRRSGARPTLRSKLGRRLLDAS